MEIVTTHTHTHTLKVSELKNKLRKLNSEEFNRDFQK